MNPVVWAEMQTQDVLAVVDMLVPDLIKEEDIDLRFHSERYQMAQSVIESKEGLTPREKVATGFSLVAAGAAALLMPGNAWTAAQIQLVFQLGFANVGAIIAGPWGGFVGFAVGTVVGGYDRDWETQLKY